MEIAIIVAWIAGAPVAAYLAGRYEIDSPALFGIFWPFTLALFAALSPFILILWAADLGGKHGRESR